MRLAKFSAVAVIATVLLAMGSSFTTTQAVDVPFADIQNFVRSVTVQITIELERHHRPLEWYQEVDSDGVRGEWKVRYGQWQDPESVQVAGSGAIVYSGRNDIYPEGATLIMTNAHVVMSLVRRESLGTRTNPLDVYAESDLIISREPINVRVRENARPIAQEYFRIPSTFVNVRHRPDQTYRVLGSVVAYDLSLDIALIEIPRVWGLPYASFRDTPARVGEEIWKGGAPLGIPFSIDRGRINQVGLNLGSSMGITWGSLKGDVPSAPGSSGSGIYDRNGRLIGCLHATLVYRNNYIQGGKLIIDGQNIREWLMWSGWAFVVLGQEYPGAPYAK